MQRQPFRNVPGSYSLLALAVASCFGASAQANPTGPAVVAGQAAIVQSGKSLTVTNTPGAVIHWQSFSIARDELTRFVQQSAASAVLNRVVGQDPSKILGTLTSNGRVFLINPNGILFGEGARIDVAGMVASSLNMTDKDFAAGRLKFGDTPGARAVENHGSIRTETGGEVLLIAPDVKNSGIITSPKGEVILAAGKSVEIVDPKSPHMRVEITAPDNQAINLGTLIADGGRVSIYATSIRNSGRIQANTVERTGTGEIVLKAKKDVTLEKASVITANGESAGRVVIQAETGTASINGVVEAKAMLPVEPPAPAVIASDFKSPSAEIVAAKSQSAVVEAVVQSKTALPAAPAKVGVAPAAQAGYGGEVKILGERVAVVEASIDASGPAAGGTVLIGGDYQGTNADIQNARFTYVGPRSTINVDATQAGPGGRAIVWADEATHFAATLTARGGTGGGDGGFVETSGKGMLIVRRAPDVAARRNGRGGTWLLDPTDITIGGVETGISDVDPTANFEFRGSGTTSTIAADTITAALASGNVVVSTASAAGGTGNITVAQSFSYTSTNSLTLQADNDIVINGFQITNSGAGAIALNAGAAGRVLVQNGGVSTAGGLSVTGRELEVIGGTSAAFLESTGSTVSITVSDLLRVDSGTSVGAIGRITSTTGQTISAKHIELVAQNDGARIENTTSGTQTITTSGANAGGEGILVENLNSSAASAQIVNAGGGQTVTVNNADHLRVQGLGGSARIAAAGDQTVLVQGSGLNGIALGDASALRSSLITSSAGNQSVTAGQAAQQGSIIVAGGVGDGFNSGIVLSAGGGTQDVSARTSISLTGGQSAGVAGSTLCVDRGACGLISTTTTGAQSVSAAGISITGGSSGSSNIAGIFGNSGASQTITIANGGTLALTGGAGAGTANTADISNNGATQTIAFSSGGALQLTGGTTGKLNFARIRAQGASSTQTISGVTSISLAGGASGGGFTGGTSEGNFAQIRAGGAQNIGVGAGGISLTGGGGTQTDNFAMIFQAGTTATSQQITSAGDITLQGGTSSGTGGVNGSFAYIRADGFGGQTIDFGAGRALSLTGGINGSNNYAQVRSTNGTQTITGAPAVTLAGGASGGASNEGNYALINASNGNSQNLTLGATTLSGGATGVDNFAAIRANVQTVSVAGNLTLTGSGGGSGSGGSRIGSDADAATNLGLDVSGAIQLNGGAFANAGSALGPSNSSVTAQDSNVNVTAGGNITLSGGSVAGTRIGAPAGLVGAGTITVTSTGGSILLASNGTTGGNIRTTGSVTLSASAAGQSITQASTASTIAATTLTTNSNAGTSLLGTNQVTNLFATTAGGNIAFNNAQSLTLGNAAITTPAGAQTVNISTTGVGSDITIAGTTNTDDNITLTASGNVVTLGTLTGASVTTILVDTWTGGGGDLLWANGANWSRGAAPTAAQDAVIPDINGAGVTDTIVVASGTQTARRVTSAENLTVSGGSLTLSGAASTVNGVLAVSGGTLTADSPMTATGGYAQSAGTLNGSGTVTIVGAGNTWTGGTMSGTGVTTVAGGATLAVGAVTLNGRALDNTGTINYGSGGVTGIGFQNGAVLNNAGTFNVLDDTGLLAYVSGAVGAFNNTGTFTKAGGAGTSATSTSIPFVNTGTVNVNSGGLQLKASATHAGAFNVASGSTLDFNTGTHTLTAASSVSGAGSVLFSGTSTVNVNGGYGIAATGSTASTGASNIVNFNVPLTFANTLTLSGGDTSQLGGSGDLTVNGNFIWSGGGDLTGTGRFTTNGITSISHDFNGLAKPWDNFGTVNMTGVGQVSYFLTPATWTNKSTGVINLQGSSTAPIRVFSSSGHAFVNEGTINKTIGSAAVQSIGTSVLSASNAGTINIASGTLQMAGSGADTGTYNIGAATNLAFTGGTRALNAGTNVVNAGAISVAGAAVTVASGVTLPVPTALTVSSGSLTLNAGSNVAGAGTLTVSGGSMTVNGSYDLSTTGTTTISGPASVVTFNTPLTFDNTFTLTGSDTTTLTGTGDLTLNGNFVWSGSADVTGTGRLTTHGTTTIDSVGTGLAKHWDNFGTVNVTGAGVVNYFGAASTWTNKAGGVVNLQGSSAAPITVFSATGHAFVNEGTLNKLVGSAATQSIGTSALTFGNAGSVDVASGTLRLTGSGTHTGAFNAGAGATLEFNAGTHNLDAGTSMTGSGSVLFSNTAVINANTSLSIANPVTLAGATLQGSGNVTLDAGGTWSSGTYTGTGQLIVPTGQTLTLSSAAEKDFGTATLVNNGTVAWSGGNIEIVGSGAITNSGLFDIQTDGNFGDQFVGVGTLTFVNNAGATLAKSAGAGLTAFGSGGGGTPNGVNLNNAGTVDVQSGTLSFNHNAGVVPSGTGTSSGTFAVSGGATLRFGGTHTLTGVSTVSGSGAVSVEHGTFTTSGTWSNTGTLTVNGGTATFNPALAPSALTVSGGTATFNQSVSAGAMTVSSGTANVNAASTTTGLTLSGGTLQGSGALTLNGPSTWSGGAYTGSGQLIVAPGQTLTLGTATEKDFGTATLINNGTVVWSGGNIEIVGSGAITNSGLFDIQTDGNFGDQSFGVGTVTFTNNVGATLRKSVAAGLTAFGSSGGGTPNGVNFGNAGTVDVQTGTLSINHAFSGTPTGTGTSSGSFAVAGGAALRFGGTHTLTGASTVSGLGAVSVEHGTFTTSGTWSHTGALAVNNGTATFNAAVNPSTLTVVGGTATFNQSAGAGAMTVSGGTANVNAASTTTGLTLSGGTLQGSGTLTLNGPSTWSGGAYTGSGQLIVAPGQTLTLGTATEKDFGSATLLNNGTVVWSGGAIEIVGSGAITNAGLFDIQTDGNFGDQNVGIGTLTFANSVGATLRKSTGAGLAAFGSTGGGTPNAVNFSNAGTVDVQTGTLSINHSFSGVLGGSFSNTGAVNVAAGATLNASNGTFGNTGTITLLGAGATLQRTGGFTNAGTIQGTGTINVGAGNTLTNQGTITVGNSPGTLNVTGNLTMTPSSVTNVEIQSPGTTAGTDYDLINVSGAMTFDGTLNVNHLSGFVPSVGQQFQIVNYGSRVGVSDFAAFNINPAGITYSKTFNPANLTLTTTSAAPINEWNTDSSGDWSNAAFWSLGLPTSGQIVRIDRGAANPTVTVSSGSMLAGQLQSAEALAVTGGSLDLAGTSTITAGLSMSGGALTGTGSVTISGTSSWTGGTIAGAGTKTFAGGSTLNVSGAAAKVVSGTTLNLNGTTNWLGGAAIDMQGATLNIGPGGLFDVGANGRFLDATSGGGVITNSGTLRKSAGAGVSDQFGSGAAQGITNLGLVDVQAGTLQFSGAAGMDGSTHSGTFQTATGTTFNFLSGVHQLGEGAQLAGTGSYGITGSVASLTGTATGTTLASGATLTFNGATVGGTGRLVNDGTVINGGTSSIAGHLVNNGTLSVPAGTLTTNTVTGTGGTVSVSGGTLTLGAALPTHNLNFSSGAINGAGSLSVSNAFNWSGGTIGGSGALNTSGATTITGATQLFSRPWSNAGTVTLSGAGRVQLAAGATLTNQAAGIIDLTGTAATPIGHVAGAMTVNNAGTINKASASAQTIDEQFNNTGTINVNAGTLRFSTNNTDTGTYNVAGGASLEFNLGVLDPANITGAGSVDFKSGTVRLNSGFSLASTGTVTISGASVQQTTGGLPWTFNNPLTVTGGQLISNGTITLNNDFVWSGGTFVGGSTLTTASTSTITTPTGLTGNWDNSGIATIGGAGQVQIAAGATFNNQNTLNLTGTGAVPIGTNGGPRTVVNIGTINKSSAGTQTIDNQFTNTNTGVVNVSGGELAFTSFPTNAGAIALSNGATLSTSGLGLINTGTIGGVGTINLGASALANRGTLRAGNSPGTLNVTGDLVLDGVNGSITDVEIGGTTPGTQYDVINVSGQLRGGAGDTSNLGTLNVTHFGGFTPTSGQQFDIINAGSVIAAADFTTKNFPATFNYGSGLVGNLYQLTVLGVPIQWIFDGNGFWDEAAKWSTGTVPTAGDDVQINRAAGSFTVTVRSGQGAQTARTLTMAGDDNLAVAGDSLTLGTPTSSVNGVTTLSGGTLTANGPLSLNTLTFTGGTLAGTGTVTVNNAFTNSGAANTTISGSLNVAGTGSMTGSGSTAVTSTGTLNISSLVNSSRLIDNAGTVVFSGNGQMNTNSAVPVLNNQSTGLVDIRHTGDRSVFSGDGGGAETITNAGIFRKSTGTGTSTLSSMAFVNSAGGTVQVQSGTLDFGTSSVTSSGTFDTASGASTSFSGTNGFGNGTAFTGAGTNKMTAGSQTFSGTVTVNNLELAGGTYGGTATFTRSSGPGLTWSGGAFSGGAVLTLDPTMLSTIAGAGAKTINNYRLANQGTLTWAAGAGNVGTNTGVTVIDNSGLFLIQNDSTLQGDGGGFETVINSGTIRKNAATGTSTFSAVTLNNAGGTLDIQSGQLSVGSLTHSGATSRVSAGTVNVTGGGTGSGTMTLDAGAQLNVTGGTQTLAGGTTIAGAGAYRVSGGTLDIAGAVNATNVDVASGTLSGAGNLTISGTMNFSGGTQGTGTTTVASGGMLNVTGAGTKTLSRTLVNESGGTINVSGTGQINTNSATTVIDNRAGGQINISADQLFQGDGGGNEVVTNAGTITKSGSAGSTLSFNGVTFNNASGGVLDVQSGTAAINSGGASSGSFAIGTGAILDIGGGGYTLNAGATSTGAGHLRNASGGTLNVAGNASVNNLIHTSGVIDGPAILTVNGTMTWSGGSMTNASGSTAVASGARIDITGPVSLSRLIDNSGTVALSGSGQITTINAIPVLTNQSTGVVDIQNNGGFAGDGGANETITNAGVFRKSGGAATSSLANVSFVNATGGSVQTQSGTLSFASGAVTSGGTFDTSAGASTLFAGSNAFGNGTQFTGAGINKVTGGSQTFSGTATVNNLELAGGTYGGTATFTQASGPGLVWSAGNFDGGGVLTLDPTTSSTISGAGAKTINNYRLANQGTLTWAAGAGNVNTTNAVTVLDNSGLFLIQNDSTLAGDGGGFETVTNSGTIRKTAATGTSTLSSVTLNNAPGGVLEVQSGTVQAGGFSTNSGTIRTSSGATFSSGGSAFTNASGAVIEGSGTINTGAAAVVNNGTVRPGGTNAIGTLTLTGALTQGAAGALQFEAAGTVPGQFDVLNVGGALTGVVAGNLGALSLSAIGGYTPAASDNLALLGYGSRAGLFSSLSGPGGFFSNPVYTPTSFAVRLGTSALNSWVAAGDGNWDVASNWSLGHVPLSSEDVLIPDIGAAGASNTITVPSAGQQAQSLTSSERLTISSTGVLALNQASSVAGLTTLSGGTLTGAGDVTLAGGLAWTGGTISGSGAVNVTGGTLALTTASGKTLDAKTLSNSVAGSLTGSDLTLANGAIFANRAGATLSLTTNGFVRGAGAATLLNEGTINKSNSGTTVAIGDIAFVNTGTTNVTAGTLSLPVGSATSGAGTFNVTGGAAVLDVGGTLSTGVLNINSANVQGSGSIATDALNMTAGIVRGSGGFSITGASTFNSVPIIDGRAIDNFGNATQLSQLRINNGAGWHNKPGSTYTLAGDFPLLAFTGAGSFRNEGTFTKSAGTGIANVNNLTFDNLGTVSANAGDLQFIATSGTHSGPYSIASGATLTFTSNLPNVFNAGATVSGPGKLVVRSGVTSAFNDTVNVGSFETHSSGIANFNAMTTIGDALVGPAAGAANFNAPATIGSLHLRGGGTLGGTGNVSVGTLTMNGGIVSGSGIVSVSGNTLISTNATDNPTAQINQIVGRTVESFGTTTHSGMQLRLNSGATFVNRPGATYDLTDDSSFLSFTLPGTFNNQGAFTKSGGSGASVWTNLTLNNTGTLNVDSGELHFNNTGGTHSGPVNVAAGATFRLASGPSHTFNTGAQLNGAGRLVVQGAQNPTFNDTVAINALEAFGAGNATFNAPVTITNVTVGGSGGGAAFNAAANVASLHARGGGTVGGSGDLTVGSLQMNGGSITGTGAFVVNGTASISTNATDNPLGNVNQVAGRTITNRGTATQAGADLRLNGGAVWSNEAGATYAITDDFGMLTVGGGTFANAGTFAKTGGSGTSLLTGLALSNSGTLSIGSGELRLNAASLTNTGSIGVATGATFGIPQGFTLTGGTLGGTGTVAGNLTNSGGIVQPGGANSIGTLTISGNYTQGSGGQLDIDLGGTGAGQVDRLAASGTASLGGTLNVVSANGYVGSPGDVTDIVTATSRTAAFASINGAFAQPVTALYSPSSVRITLAPANANAWSVDADGDWNNPANWNLGHVPTAGEDVLIDRPSGLYTIAVPNGAQDVRSVVAAENLVLGGGSVSVQQASSFNGRLNVAGGALTGAGNKAITDLVLSAGTISGSGNVTVGGAYTHTGGTIDIGGSLAVTPTAGDIRVGGSVRASTVELVSPGAIRIDAPVTALGTLGLSSGGDTTFAANTTAGAQLRSVLGGADSILSVMNTTVTAPQFDVVFTQRPQGGVFVDGTESVLTSGSAGFFTAGNQAAVFGTTFRVTYLMPGIGGFGGPIQESAPVNQLVQAVTRSTVQSTEAKAIAEASKERLEDEVAQTEPGGDKKENDEKRRRRQVCS